MFYLDLDCSRRTYFIYKYCIPNWIYSLKFLSWLPQSSIGDGSISIQLILISLKMFIIFFADNMLFYLSLSYTKSSLFNNLLSVHLLRMLQIVPADELKKNEINSFFEAIKGAWSMMWSGLVDFFTGRTCRCVTVQSNYFRITVALVRN